MSKKVNNRSSFRTFLLKNFNISDINSHQEEAIRSILLQRIDTFVNLPTGFITDDDVQRPHKLPCYFTFDQSQVNLYLNSLGIKSASLSLVDKESDNRSVFTTLCLCIQCLNFLC